MQSSLRRSRFVDRRKKRKWAIAFLGILLLLLGGLGKTALAADMMLICSNDFEEAVRPLAEHKNRTGISTEVFTIRRIILDYPRKSDGSSFHDAPERLKHAIYDQYLNHGTRYVLLMGDCTRVPVRFVRGYLDDYTPNDTYPTAEMIWEPSDLYYADLVDSSGHFQSWDRDGNNLFGEIYREGVNWDEIDYHPDVYVARVPADTVAQVENYVTKVIRYEYRTTGKPWFRTMTFSAHDLMDWAPVETMEAIATQLAPQGFTYNRLYHNGLYASLPTAVPPTPLPSGDTPTPYPTPRPTDPLPTSDGDPLPAALTTAYTNGTGFHFHSGHGSLLSWGGESGVPVFTDADVAALNNQDTLPIIFADSCETARFCPYIPYNDYLTASSGGSVQTAVDRYSIGTWICPEPAPLQWAAYNQDALGERFTVASESGAIAYWGCSNTGERQSLVLGREFFAAYRPRVTLGEMWKQAIEAYYANYRLFKYDRSYNGNNGDTWIFHHPERFLLFGDPSLRVGGVAGLPDDTTPPHTTHNVDHVWYRNEFTLVLTATDTGCGVKQTHYRVGTGGWQEGETFTFSIPNNTVQTFNVTYYSEDFINPPEATRDVTIQMETKNPDPVSVSMTGNPSAEAGVDYSGPVTITLNSADANSGLDFIEYRLEVWYSYYGGFYGPYSADYSLGPFPFEFRVNEPGHYRLTAEAVDRAGNRSVPVVRTFITRWVDYNWLHDMAHILQGPVELALAPKLELPFDPLEVLFYFRPRGGNWTVIGADTNPNDGWTILWETPKVRDGIYDLQAVAFESKLGRSTQAAAQKEIPLSTCAVMNNRTPMSDLFTLKEIPRIAQPLQPVQHLISFDNQSKEDLNNLEIHVDLGTGGQYDLSTVQVLDNGQMDGKGVILWSLKSLPSKGIWQVRFEAAARKNIPTGTIVSAQAYLQSDEIPVLASDDPITPLVTGDPSQFQVQSQGGVLAGHIYDSYSRQALEGTTITLQETRQYVLADSQGAYRFSDLPGGLYKVFASHPPAFGSAEAAVTVDAELATLDLYLERLDIFPPKAYLKKPFEESVVLGDTGFSGTAVDNPQGSGVATVRGCLKRLDTMQYWNGTAWASPQIWFTAKGTTNWELNFEPAKFDPLVVYSLILQAEDQKNNLGTFLFYSTPPTPTGLQVANTKVTRQAAQPTSGNHTFTWDKIPGCQYVLNVSMNPHHEPAFIHEYLDANSFTTKRPFWPGLYYWWVCARVGNITSPPSEMQAFYVSEQPENASILEVH